MARKQGARLNFNKFFAEFDPVVKQNAIKALAFGASLVVDEQKAKCPVGKKSKTSKGKGALKESIKAIPNGTGTKIIITTNAKNPQTGKAYGPYVEFDPRIKKPFFFDALPEQREEVKELVIEAIRTAVRTVARY